MEEQVRQVELAEAWVEGRQAARDGAQMQDNPHSPDGPLARSWERGWRQWTDACNDARHSHAARDPAEAGRHVESDRPPP
ncbi:hypothetical protein CSC62_14065 [Pseudoxanthomonas jiangsuensis]|uniref:ribosome modulation factor n=1 Tax=Pseudoxanthomonas jiangsuensis TaxID=619688 RepID=UPI001390A3F3|nr:hypothetical protein [Pseudoxanthomonas jiangsuensis]KAF1692755.1 hypothetical protein CSC62_14065 [Pseudoxanthomonas jiangsuensis]